MRKIILIFIFPLFSILSSFSQEEYNPLADYLSNFQYQKALEYIDTQEPSKDLLAKKALCYKALGEYYKAIEILQPLSKEYANEIKIISDLAVCYEAIGKRQASADCYEELIRLDSTNLYFKSQKAEMLYQLGKYNGALSLFQSIYNFNNTPTALKKIAQCFEKMNLLDSAKIYFEEAWDRNPRDAFSVANLTNICLKEGSIYEAITYSERYMESDTTDQQINLLNALCYYKLDDYEESVIRLKRCYLNGDTSLIVNRSLGIACYSLNMILEARPYLESAYRMDTTNNNVLYCLAVSYTDIGDYEKAIPLYSKLLQRTIPEDLTLFLYFRNMARCYERMKNNENAIENYQQALLYANENQKMNLYYTIGLMSDKDFKDYKKALEYYKLYRKSLLLFLNEQDQKEDKDEIVLVDIENTKVAIKNLDKRIVELGGNPAN